MNGKNNKNAKKKNKNKNSSGSNKKLVEHATLIDMINKNISFKYILTLKIIMEYSKKQQQQPQ